ncbi:hypothetical protein AFCDBAGC_1894 [Methylobacterium cerastii]|uniref:Uncharacterized protein n=1 Tax=Methylobacterium cerastii TaxID=932741 RepID=A0ABQ4QGL4_9HYPH|nr:hypothetical protein AFCDBAGC_1894 [Methylobacterium cerastii]
MAPVARRPAAAPMADEPDVRAAEAGRGRSRVAADATAANTVVPLFAAPEVAGGPSGPGQVVDWPSAIAQIREAGAHLRRMHDVAQAMSRHARAMIRRSLDQTEEAERRAHTAEAAAVAASLRADGAEERLRQAEARARLAEDRAAIAVAAEAEAQIWLRRTYACLKAESSNTESSNTKPAKGDTQTR